MTRKAEFRFEELPIRTFRKFWEEMLSRLYRCGNVQITIPLVSACNASDQFVDFDNRIDRSSRTSRREKKEKRMLRDWKAVTLAVLIALLFFEFLFFSCIIQCSDIMAVAGLCICGAEERKR